MANNSKKQYSLPDPEEFLQRVMGAFNDAEFRVTKKYICELCKEYKILDVEGINAISELDFAGTRGFKNTASGEKIEWSKLTQDARARMYQRRFGRELLMQSIEVNPNSCAKFCKDNGEETLRKVVDWSKRVLDKQTQILSNYAYRETILKQYEHIRPFIIKEQLKAKREKYGG